MVKKLWYILCSACRPRQSRTVRYAFPLVVLALIFASTATVVTKSKSFITIEVEPATVKKDELFFVNVTATAHVPVNAIDITVRYPESQMKVSGIDTGESVITLWTKEPYARNGIVYLTGGTFRKGFIGKHLIARIRMTATEAGTARVSADSARFIAGDGKGTEVAVADSGNNSVRMYISNTDGSIVGKASVFIITDIDGNGRVDLRDISAFMAAWFNKSHIFDFNGDGRMTFRDFSILLADSFFK
jgi:hypothetical protein